MIQQASTSLLAQQATQIQHPYGTILQLIPTILIQPRWIQPSITLLYSHDTASYYAPILLLILQAIMLPYYHWYLIQQPNILIYTIDSASFPIILWHLDTTPNTATLMIRYSDILCYYILIDILLIPQWPYYTPIDTANQYINILQFWYSNTNPLR